MEIYSLDKTEASFSPMYVVVVSGFLGAGKTTFIRQMTKALPDDYCVLENEFGEAEVDRTLLAAEGLNVWELSSGCICCSGKGNFETSVMTIANMFSPRVLIIETSGVSLLSQVMDSLRKIAYARIRILDPIVIVDACNYHQCSMINNVTFFDQVQSTRNIVLSKTNLVTLDDLARIKDDLLSANSEVCVYTDSDTRSPVWWREKCLLSSGVAEKVQSPDDDLEWETVSFQPVGSRGLNDIIRFLQMIVNGLFGYIPRAKGFINSGAEMLKVDTVGKIYTIEKVDVATDARIVLIGRDINRDAALSIINGSVEKSEFCRM